MDNSIIQRDREKYQKEKDEFLYSILDNRFFYAWRRGPCMTPDDVPAGGLELFITPTCNQKCEYCYLQRHINDLYPKENNNRETIIKNFKHVLDWCVEEDFNLPNLDLYSGEIWHTSFGLELLDIAFDYIANKGLRCNKVSIPTNATFLENKLQTIEIQNRINDFRSIGSALTFSLSIDGKYLEDIERERNDGTLRDDDFYEKVFTFAKHNDFGFHPMLAAKSAKYWKENFEWWLSMFKKYELPIDRLMLLEVRNDDWEEEDIEAYKDFLRYLMEFTLNFHGGDFHDTVDDLLMLNQVYATHNDLLWGEEMNYIPISFSPNRGYYGCTLPQHLTVRLGDLAICPCHRTAYNKYLYGWFVQDENGRIIDVKANNPQVAVNLLFLDNRNAILGCDSCTYRNFCLGTCRGQSIEATKDIFQNDPKVCNFLKQKYYFTFKLYEEYGIMSWLEENLTEYHSGYSYLKNFVETWKRIKQEDKDRELEQSRQNIYWEH